MNGVLEAAGLWLADFHLLAGLLMVAVIAALAALGQPARRMAVTKAALASTAALAVLCALPGWSVIHLMRVDAPAPVATEAALQAEPWPQTATMGVSSQDGVLARSAVPENINVAPAAEAAGPWSWSRAALAIYAAGSAAVIGWLAAGAVAARRVRLEAAPASSDAVRLLQRVVGNARAPELLVSDRVETAAAMGVWRPRIILGTGLVTEGNPPPLPSPPRGGGRMNDALAAVLAHEWAHIRHGDLRTLAGSRLLLVLLWPQPLFWLVRRWMRLDQETLADAAAVEVSGRVDYAEQLLGWAQRAAAGPRGRAPRLAGAVGLWEGPSQLKRRVAALLDDRFMLFRECSRRWRVGSACLLLAAATALSLVTVKPTSRAAEETAPAPASKSTAETAHSASVAQPLGTVVAVKGDPFKPEKPYKENTLAYRILDESGQPVAGVEALLYRVQFRDGSFELVEKATTNEAGEVEFADVCSAEAMADFKRRREAEDYYSPEIQRSLLVAVRRAGLATTIFFQNEYGVALYGSQSDGTLLPARELSGRVTGPDGRPVANALVAAGSYASNLAIEGVNAVRTDGDGRYAFKDRPPFDAAEAKKQQQTLMQTAAKATEAMTEEELKARRPKPGYDMAASNVVVLHPGFAVAAKAGGDIPGTNDVQLAPAAILAGRVVNADTGQGAAGIKVRLSGQPQPVTTKTAGGESTTRFPAYSHHSASTQTDAEGRYRFDDLPSGDYDVWAAPESSDLTKAGWANRGLSGVKAVAGQTAKAPDLTIGKPGVIRGQLVDAKTKQPLKLEGKNPTVRVLYELVGGPHMQDQFMQTAACTADGRFEAPAVPGKIQLMVFVYGDGAEPKRAVYRSEDEVSWSRPTLDVPFGQVVDANVAVRSAAEVSAIQEAQSTAWKLYSDGQPVQAFSTLKAAIDKFPTEPSLLSARAHMYREIGDDASAAVDFERALKLAPDDIGGRLTLASLLATSPEDGVPNGQRAVELAEGAAAALWQAGRVESQSSVLNVLAAAYAEAGEFDKAVAAQQKAVAAAPANEKAAAEKRLELYRAGKPFRKERSKGGASTTSTSAPGVTGTLTAAAGPVASVSAAPTTAVGTVPTPEKFVRMVVGKDGAMTFEGEKTTEAALPALLEKAPNRERTVLEVAIASDEMSVRESNEAQALGLSLARQFKFLYTSYVGVHPLGSKGGEKPQPPIAK